jgi:hypothetical protein
MTQGRAHRLLRVLAPALVVVSAGVLARADAPADQYVAFNRADTVITDAKTGLNWQRTVTTSTDFPGAVAACNALSLYTFSSGWRLPSYKELLTLVDESPHDEYPTGAPQPIAIDGNAFPETPVDKLYWTSSIWPGNGEAYVVQFKDGTAQFFVTAPGQASAYVRCVQ